MSSTEETMYKKHDRTTGLPGQLYETKLVGFALFKLLHDEQIEYFYLASNLDEIGCFDDLCFKAKIRGIDRPFLVFIQAKHKEDDNAYVDFDEAKHFHDSYSKVVQKFYLSANDKKNKDKIFIGNFEDYECVFILYTNGKYKNDSGIDYESAYSSVLNELISTGRKGTKLHCTDQIVEDLVEAVLKVEIEGLAEHFTKFLSASQSMQMMLDDVVKRYHVVLALHAVNVSEIYSDEKKPDFKWRIMTFREDFFKSNDKHLSILKKAMFKKILQNHAISKNKKPIKDPKLEAQLQAFFVEPSLNTLSPLIGTCIVSKSEKLEFASQRNESEKEILKQIKLSQDVIEEAEAIVARNILLSPELRELKVPVTFGNTDLMISERRITHLSKNIVDLCKTFNLENGHKVVTLDETVDSGILNINGGLGGTVGNLLVYEESTKLLQFVDNPTSLQNNARLLFEKLQCDLAELHLFRFYTKPMLPFPVLSFDCDSGIARKISNKLVIYAGQSDQKRLEIKLKNQIEDYQKAKYPNMQVQAESLFQNYHSNIQTWSMIKTKGPYLTKESKIYQEALNNIFFEPQMSSLRNTFHMTKMKHIEYSTESLKTLQRLSRQKEEEIKLELAEIAVIVTDVAILTAIKVIQYLRSNGVNSYSVLDLECLLNLPTEDFCALKLELKKSEKVLLIMCHNLQGEIIWYEKYLKEIVPTVVGKRKIVITHSIFVDMVQNVFSTSDKENTTKAISNDGIIYEKHSLVDLTQESQEDTMKNSKIIFQGQVTSLDLFLDETSVPFIEGVILNKIVFNETIEVGELHTDVNYDEISHLYQDRTVEYIKYHPISGRVCISSTICDTDDSQASSSNNFASNQLGDQLVGSMFSISNTDFGINENPFNMYFNFDIRIRSEEATDFLIDLLYVKCASRFKVKIKNFTNKVWNAKVMFFDNSMKLKNWLKDDSVLDDTLKAMRYLCHGATLNNLLLNEDIVVIPTEKNFVNEKYLQCFYFENNSTKDENQKDAANNAITDDPLKKSASFKEHAQVASNNNVTIDDEQKDSESNVTIDNSLKESGINADNNIKQIQIDSDNNVITDDALKDSNTNSKDHAQTDFYSNVTIDDTVKDSDSNTTIGDELKGSGCNFIDDKQIDDNSVSIDEEQKDYYNNATLVSAEKHSDNTVSSDDEQKDFVKSFRMYFERYFFQSLPDISIVANNLQDESLIKDTPENIHKDDHVLGDNVRLDESLSKCEENVHNFQIKFRSKHRIELKSFDDLKDDVVLLTAKAGLGKSTILTHLSRKTNKLNKHVWVVRMNLLNFSGEFRKWQRFQNIGTLTALNLIVQVVFKNITVNLKEDSGKILFENCSGDVWVRFNLKMFLNYYNNGKLLFIFDGFDEICPDYKDEVVLFLNVVKNNPSKNKMWITSRPYNAILPDLERRFGKSYRLEYLNKAEQTEYLRRYWDKTINLKNASTDSIESLVTIISMVISVVDIKLKIICYDFCKYVVGKFSIEHSDETKVKMEVIEKVNETVTSDMNSEDNEFMGTPLLLHLIAGFFVTQVLDFRKLEKVGHVNIITMYEWFINTKLIKILFMEKYGMNVDIPFVKERCEAELKQSLTMYKKFGAQAIFGDPIFEKNGLNLEEFNDLAPFNLSTERGRAEFDDAINRIWIGKDRTGLISYITDNGTPVFIHKTFAEYFAVEYISDILKSENVPYETKKLVMTVMLSIILKESVVDDCGKLVSRGSLSNWVRQKCIVDEDYNKIGVDILGKEPFIDKYNSVINTISNETVRRGYIRLINSTADDYEDPSFKECNIEEYLSGKRKFDDDLFLIMKPHFRRKFSEFSKWFKLLSIHE